MERGINMKTIITILVLASVCFAQWGPGGIPTDWRGYGLEWMESAKFTSASATSYQYFASSAAADSLVWRQVTAVGADDDMVFKFVEEDGTVHYMRMDDGASRCDFDLSLFTMGTVSSSSGQMTMGSNVSLAGTGYMLYTLSNALVVDPGAYATGGNIVLGRYDGATDYINSMGNFSTGLLSQLQSPDFAASTGWTLVNTTITSGKLRKLTAAGVGTAVEPISVNAFAASAVYLVHIDVDSLSTGHDIVVTMGGTTFATITAEGSDQWFRGTTVNATSPFTIAWGDGETGIVDNVYVYRLSGRMTIAGSAWNQVWTKITDYAVLEGDCNLTFDTAADTLTCTLPALATCWDALTSTGRRLSIKNIGAYPLIIDASTTEDIDAADTLIINQWDSADLQATPARWEIR